MAAMLPLGAALLIALRWIRRDRSPSLLQHALAIAGCLMVHFGALGFALQVLFPFSLLVWFAAPLVWLFFRSARNKAEWQAVLTALALAAEKGIPLAPTMESLAADREDRLGDQLAACAASIRNGQTLRLSMHDALRWQPDARTAIALGELTGDLSQALRAMVLEDRKDRQVERQQGDSLTYMVLVCMVALAMLVFGVLMLSRNWSPSILADLDAPIPKFTAAMIAIASNGVGWMTAAIVLASACGYLLLVFDGKAPYYSPRQGRLQYFRKTSLLLHCLATAVRCKLPLESALRLFAAESWNRRIRRELSAAATRVEQGGSWIESLRESGWLAEVDAALLAAASRVGNLGWALDTIAQRHRRRNTQRLQWVVNAFAPLVLLLMAAGLGAIAIALFQPLIALITKVS